MQKQIAKNGGSKGITLIALVITIIVLLILAGVTISMVLGDDGIIAQAQGAKTAQEDAEKEEQGEIRKGEGNIDLYTEGTVANMVEVGDYVKYEYTPDDYSTSETGAVEDPDENGNEAIAQTFSSKTGEDAVVTNWRVLSKENGIVKLVSENPVSSLILKGVNGYLNGVKVLDDMCKKLYSSDIGTARSIKMEDVNEVTGYKVEEAIAIGKLGEDLKLPYGITIKEAAELDEIQYDINDFGSNEIETEKKLGDYKLTAYQYILENNNKLLLTNNKWYWIATPAVFPSFGGNVVGFGIYRRVIKAFNYDILCDNEGTSYYDDDCMCSIRPIVVLNAGLKVADEKAIITDGNGTQQEAWVIKD